MKKAWGWVVAGGIALLTLLAWMLGRRDRTVVAVESPLPEVEADLALSEAAAKRDMDSIDERVRKDLKASEKAAERDAMALSADVDELHRRFRRRMGAARPSADGA